MTKRKLHAISQPTDLPAELAHDPVAREFHHHLATLLKRLGLWRPERAHLVALAAQYESRRRRAEEVLARDGLIVNRNGELRAHPAVRVELMAVRALRGAWRDLDLLRSREPACEAEAKWSEFVNH
jgi:phage terminase small subunit